MSRRCRLYISVVAATLVGMQAGLVAPAAATLGDPLGASTAAGRSVLARISHTASRLDGAACAPALCGWVLVAGGRVVGSGATASAELYDPTHRAWSPTGSMSAPRAGHTATVLADGRVLVAGGISGSSSTAAAELFDAAGHSQLDGSTVNGAWSPAAPMLTARNGHTATSLRDGRVLVAGGGSATTELYDPGSGTWTAGPPMSVARTGHTATLLDDGRVLVAGGGTAGAEIYDPATAAWSATAPMDVARTGHTATLLSDGRVLVAGGSTSTGAPLAGAALWSPASGTWSSAGSMAVGRSSHSSTLLPDGRVLVVGGAASLKDPTAELWLPNTGAWTSAGPTIASRVLHTATLLGDGTVLLTGGRDPNSVVSSMTETFDPRAAAQPPSVTGVSPAAGSFLGGTAVTISGAAIDSATAVTVGGTPVEFKVVSATTIQATAPVHAPGPVDVTVTTPAGTSPPIDASRFAFVDGSWTSAHVLGAGRVQPTATRITLPGCKDDCERVLVAGGGVAKSTLYDPKDDAWDDTGTTNTTLGGGATATLLPDGRVLLAGGGTASAEIYDPGAAMWSDAGTMSAARTSHTATLLATGKVLVAGGGSASAELYDPATNHWSPAGSMSMTRSGHTATLVAGGRVLVAGGAGAGGPTSSVEEYDPAVGWSAAAPMAVARTDHTATALGDGTVLVAGGCCDGGYKLASAERFDPATGAWSPAGSMAQRRDKMTATTLVDGSVMVVGGCCDATSTSLATADVYRPHGIGGLAAGWAPAPSLVDGREAQAAVILPSGRLLVVGGVKRDRGSIGSALASAEVLTTIASTPPPTVTAVSPPVGPISGGTEVQITGHDFVASPLSVVRFGDAAATDVRFLSTTTIAAKSAPAAKGTVPVTVSNPIGVSDPTVASTFTYGAGNWATTGSMHQAREHHTATLLDGPACRGTSPPSYCNKVLIAGGTDRFWLTGKNLDSAELYDPATGAWSETGSMLTGRFDQTATLLDGPACRRSDAPSYCGKVLVTGGERETTDGGSITFVAQASSELYDPATGTWSATGSLHAARFSHTMTLLNGAACQADPAPAWCGKVLVAGGTNNESDRPPLASSELYDPAGDNGKGSWAPTGDLDPGCTVGCGRVNHTATQLRDGRVVATGGFGSDKTISPFASYGVLATAQVGDAFTTSVGHNVVGTPDPNRPVLLTASANRPRGSAVSPGEEVTITWSYANVSNVAVPARIVPVDLPRSVDFVSAQPAGTFDALTRKVMFGPIADVSPNGSIQSPAGSFSIAVKVRETSTASPGQPSTLLPDATYMSFLANLESTNPAPATAPTSQVGADAQLYLSQPAAVRLAASSDPPSGSAVKPGDQITYRLAWFNTGSVASAPVVVTDVLPPSAVDFVSASDGGSFNPSTGTVMFPGISVPPRTSAASPGGAVSITVTVRSTAPGGVIGRPPVPLEHNRPLTNSAAISGLASNPVVHTLVQPTGPAQQPRVAVSSNPPAGSPVTGGDRITYTIAYFNSGTETADGVVVDEPITSGAKLVATSPDGLAQPGSLASLGPVAIPPGTTAAHPAGTFTVTVEVPTQSAGNSPGWMTNTPKIRNGAGANPEQHWLVPPALRISIVADPPTGSAVNPADTVTYRLSWFNTGPIALDNVAVGLTLGSRLQFVSASSGGTYDPSTETVEFAPVSVAGGTNGDHPAGTAVVTALVGYGVVRVFSTTEIYDPGTGKWTLSAATMSSDRFGHTATLLGDGRVLVAGGFNAFPAGGGLLASGADIYDPVQDTWSSPKHLPNTGQGGHSATVLPDGTILFAGGSFLFPGESPAGTSVAQLFDPSTETWSWTNPMISPRGVHTATLLDGPACSQPSPPASCGSVLLAGGLGPAGGISANPKPGDPVPSTAAAEIYTPSPNLKGLTPAAGPEAGGAQVTLSGSGFAGASVMFGTTPASAVNVDSPSRITAIVPAHVAGRVPVTVSNAGGLSTTLPANPAHLYAYGGPARVSDLTAQAMGDTSVRLRFSAPGSAGPSPPPAARYDVRQSLTPIDDSNFDAGFGLCEAACTFGPAKVGDPLSLDVTSLDPATTYYYALRGVNDQGLAGPVSNPASALTGSEPQVAAPAAGPGAAMAPDGPIPATGTEPATTVPEVTHPVITRIVPGPAVPAPATAPATVQASASPPTTRSSSSPPADQAQPVLSSSGSWAPGPMWWAAGLAVFGAFAIFAWRRYFHNP